jgi:hypothetical protein
VIRIKSNLDSNKGHHAVEDRQPLWATTNIKSVLNPGQKHTTSNWYSGRYPPISTLPAATHTYVTSADVYTIQAINGSKLLPNIHVSCQVHPAVRPGCCTVSHLLKSLKSTCTKMPCQPALHREPQIPIALLRHPLGLNQLTNRLSITETNLPNCRQPSASQPASTGIIPALADPSAHCHSCQLSGCQSI